MSWVPPDRPSNEPPGGDGAGDSGQATPPPWPPPGGQPEPTGPPGHPTEAPPQHASAPAGVGTWAGSNQPPDGPRRPRGPLAVIVAVAVVLVLVAGVATVLLLGNEDDPGAAAPDTTTTEPESTTTDPDADPDPAPAPAGGQAALEAAVAELSTFVAEARGAPFPEPVTVELLEGQAFNDRLLADFEEERADIELVGRLFVAMGLLEADQDLYEIFRDFLGVGVLGFYDPETGELVVRGAEITPYTRSTIVHELVHAYDDQRFELDRPALDEADDESSLGFTALVEGNAVRIQRAWEAELSAAERNALMAEQFAAVAGVDLGDVPLVLLAQIDFPYSSGPDLVEALVRAGGEARVDAAFGAPPVTSEQVIDPALYLEGEGPLPVPSPPADGDVIDQGSYGELTLLITLGDVLDAETARQAAQGWGGDAYVAWREGEATCVRTVFRMDTPRDLAELVAAWRMWVEEHPDADVSTSDDTVTVSACG